MEYVNNVNWTTIIQGLPVNCVVNVWYFSYAAFNSVTSCVSLSYHRVFQCPVVVAPGLVYNVQQYSGMMCQFVCELKKKRRRGGLDVIAAGGRYDNMVANFR
jgi:histidyl-tRNA synthetase